MWYLIGLVVIALIGFFVYASVKNSKQNSKRVDAEDKPTFRTGESLNTYDKPMDAKHTHIDFDDKE